MGSNGYTGKTWDGQDFQFLPLGFKDVGQTGGYNVLRIKGTIGVAGAEKASLTCATSLKL